MHVFVGLYLFHSCVAADQLLPQVGDVMIEPLHVLLEVLPEAQKGLFHFTLELHRAKAQATDQHRATNYIGNSMFRKSSYGRDRGDRGKALLC